MSRACNAKNSIQTDRERGLSTVKIDELCQNTIQWGYEQLVQATSPGLPEIGGSLFGFLSVIQRGDQQASVNKSVQMALVSKLGQWRSIVCGAMLSASKFPNSPVTARIDVTSPMSNVLDENGNYEGSE